MFTGSLNMQNVTKVDLIVPTEKNGFCVFRPEWEQDPEVFFHMTDCSNLQSILQDGFKSAAALGKDGLESVSYAKKSSGCFANQGTGLPTPQVVIAVRFSSCDLKEVVDNLSDIHVYKSCIQPAVLGYCELPSGFSLP
jgi:hypothetical protein